MDCFLPKKHPWSYVNQTWEGPDFHVTNRVLLCMLPNLVKKAWVFLLVQQDWNWRQEMTRVHKIKCTSQLLYLGLSTTLCRAAPNLASKLLR